MTPEELENIRSMLLERRKSLAGDVENLSTQALQNEGGSHLPVHLADLGSDNFNKEMALGLVETEEQEIREIDDALQKIQDGTYGSCEECEQEIPTPRLEAIPYARHCIHCQQKLEEEDGAS